MDTAIRFYYSSNIDFGLDEIKEVIVTNNIQRKVYNNQDNYYGIYRIGSDDSSYKTIDITFNIRYGGTNGTLDKINTLYGYKQTIDYYQRQPAQIDCYYKYKLDSTIVIPVKMIWHGMKWDYYCGESLLDYELPITFVEVKPSGAGMIQSPMLQTLGNGT